MSRYRVALLGCGPRGDDHLHGFTMNADRFEVVGVCDQDEERLHRVSGKYNLGCTYTDAGKMLEETKPDVYCFVTLPHLRQPLMELGLKHLPKAIVYEKPIALSLKEARAMRDMCEAAGIKTVITHAQKYGSHWQHAKQLVDRGEIGEVHTIRATSQAWLLQLGTHLLDYMLWFNGQERIEWVFGQVTGKDHLTDSHPSPDYVLGRLQFANGVNGIIECGPLAPSYLPKEMFWVDDVVTVYGTHGYVQVCTGDGFKAVTKNSHGEIISGPGTYFPLWDTPPFIRELADWLDDDNKVHCSNGDITYHGFEAAMAICQSSLEMRRIDLPLKELPEEPLFEQLEQALPDDPVLPL